MSSKTAYCRTQVNRTRPDYTAPRIHELYLKEGRQMVKAHRVDDSRGGVGC